MSPETTSPNGARVDLSNSSIIPFTTPRTRPQLSFYHATVSSVMGSGVRRHVSSSPSAALR